MDSGFGGFMDAFFGLTVLGLVGVLVVVVLIVFVVIRAIRRGGAVMDPAEEELRARLARGEIDMAEFEVRLRALRRGDAS
jgi:uncharacterized membrane protein